MMDSPKKSVPFGKWCLVGFVLQAAHKLVQQERERRENRVNYNLKSCWLLNIIDREREKGKGSAESYFKNKRAREREIVLVSDRVQFYDNKFHSHQTIWWRTKEE